MKTLVVDDNRDMADVTAILLKSKLNIDAVTCTDASEAIRLVKCANPPYDLVITDLEMPTLEAGKMVAETARQASGQTKILMISARFPFDRDIKEMFTKSNLVDVCLEKLGTFDELIAAVQQMQRTMPAVAA